MYSFKVDCRYNIEWNYLGIVFETRAIILCVVNGLRKAVVSSIIIMLCLVKSQDEVVANRSNQNSCKCNLNTADYQIKAKKRPVRTKFQSAKQRIQSGSLSKLTVQI